MKSIKQWWLTSSPKKKIITGIAVLIIIVILALLFKKKDTTVLSTTVQQGNVVSSVVLSGTTQSASAVNLGFATQGRVASISVKEGDKVHAGQVIATLDSADLQASLKNAQASLTIAKANASNTSTNLDAITLQQNILVQNAYDALLSNHLEAQPQNIATSATPPTISGTYDGDMGDYIIHTYPSGSNSGSSFSISGLETGFIQAAASNAPVPLGSHGLYVQFASGVVYGDTTWIVSIPNSKSPTYTADKNAYNAAVAARIQAISAAQASLNNQNNATSVSAAQIAQAQSQVDAVLAQISQRQIIVPFDGIVSSVNVKRGQTTSSFNPSSSASESGNANISVISQSDYEVVLKTPEIDVASLSVGQPVSLTLDAFGTEAFPGTVTSINPAETIVDGVPVYETKVAFTTLDARIRSGMTATATITIGQKDNALTVPVSFIHTDARGSYVYVLSGKHTTQQAVTTGLRGSDSTVEIISGLTAGQTVMADAQ